ncbi:hypothetical protein AX15_002752 [Amanita polypyramis BW_CC]|nr:hypothetical protein AX15_002752 [Amanita polypyramis BW_CC]
MLSFRLPAVFLLFCAFVLTLITSVSLPYLRTLDVTRTHFGERQVTVAQEPSDQLRFGVWAFCHYLLNGDRHCSPIGYAYSVEVLDVASKATISIASSWTRGLAVHPVSAIVAIIAFIVSLFPFVFMQLVAAVLSFVLMMLCFIAFLVDIALYAYAKQLFKSKANGLRTITGPGLWVNFVAMILSGLAMCYLLVGRRIGRKQSEEVAPVLGRTEKRSFLSRFKRNKEAA